MNEEKINKFIEDEVDDVLDVQFIDGERFFGLAYKHEGGLLVFDKTQQITADWDWWDVIPMDDKQVIQLLNELHEENEKLTKQLMDLKILINDLSVQRDEFFNGEIENAELNGKLQKENEQLKRFITSMGFTIEKENGTITRATKEITR